jgi:hypothetical protein
MKNRKIASYILVVLMTFGILTSIGAIPYGKALPGGTIYVTPQYNNFTNPPTNVGDWFTINVRIANYSNVAGWQVKLLYKKNVLYTTDKNVSYASDHIFPLGTYPGIPASVSDFNSTHAYVMMTTTTYGAAEYSGTDAGLMTAKFKILAVPSQSLLKLEPIDTWIVDTNIEELPEVLRSGYFEIRFPAPPPAHIFVDPAKVVNASLTPCHNFVVNVKIQDTSYLYSFQFKLSFDPTVLHVVSAQLGNIFPPEITPTIQIDNTAGFVTVAATLRPSDPPVNGDGTLAIIEFHVEALGLSSIPLSETDLRDPLNYPMPHTTSNGYFNNMLIPKLAVDPPEILDPSLVPPMTFQINITVAEVEDLYDYEFKLGYDPSVIICINLQIHDVFGEINYVPQFSINNIAGIAWVRVDYYPPAVPISTMPPVALVTLTFRIRERGISVLDLYDTELSNTEGGLIPHEVHDGIFAPLIRDVAVIDVTPLASWAYQGWIVKINVTAMNKGNVSETFDVEVYYEPANLIGTLTFTNLAPDAQETLTIDWNTAGVPYCHNYTIWAEAVPVPYEKNLADNTFTDGKVKIRIMGDVNGDGKVDGKDIAAVAAAFNTKPGNPRWNPDADFNQDGKIDGRDIAIIARYYGRSC